MIIIFKNITHIILMYNNNDLQEVTAYKYILELILIMSYKQNYIIINGKWKVYHKLEIMEKDISLI